MYTVNSNKNNYKMFTVFSDRGSIFLRTLYKISVLISQNCNRSVLLKCYIILQHVMDYNFTLQYLDCNFTLNFGNKISLMCL